MSDQRQNESLLKRSILEALAFQYPQGNFWMNRNTAVKSSRGWLKSNSIFEMPGVSDILGLYKGFLFALEVKLPENKKRPLEQVKFIELVQSHGHCAGFVTSPEEAINLVGNFVASKPR